MHSGNINSPPIAWHGQFGRSWSLPNLKLLQQPESSRPTPAPSLAATAAHSMAQAVRAVPGLAPLVAAVGGGDGTGDGSPLSGRLPVLSKTKDGSQDGCADNLQSRELNHAQE